MPQISKWEGVYIHASHMTEIAFIFFVVARTGTMPRLFFYFLVSLLATCAHVCRAAETCPVAIKAPYRRVPEHYLDLDLPPEKRWARLVAQYRPQLVAALEACMRQIPYIHKLVEAAPRKHDTYANALLGPEYAAEARALAKLLDKSLGSVLLLQIYYEIVTMCTSLVAPDAHGTMWHGRTLDWPIAMNELKPITVTLKVRRNDRILYRSTTFLGFLGVLTAVRPQGWAVSVNARLETLSFADDGIGDVRSKLTGILGILRGAHMPLMFTLRRLMETEEDYDKVLEKLQKASSYRNIYAIVSGAQAYQGAVLTYTALASDPPETRTMYVTKTKKYRKALIQTNNDARKQCPRFNMATAYIKDIPRDKCGVVNRIVEAIFDVPVANHMTLHHTWMCAARGEIHSYRQ